MELPIYLDYAATTPVDETVAERMAAYLTRDGDFGNPASRGHIYGWRAEEAVEKARVQVAALVGADTREIVWTSGATESNNAAIKGAARARAGRGRYLVTGTIEHKAVQDNFRYLEKQGFEVTWLKPDARGRIASGQVEAALRDDTQLVSIMQVNNELGTINDVAAIGAICRRHGTLFHVDAAQSVGKLPIDLAALDVDLMSFSAHKIYGPKGSGALYVRRDPDVSIEPLIHGGGHERGLRSGTLATHQIVGIGEAFRIAGEKLDSDPARIDALRRKLRDGLAAIPGVIFNGDPDQTVCGIVNASFEGVDGEALVMALRRIAVSSGSACTSASLEPSFVLREIGVSDALAHSSIRFSLGRYTTEVEVDETLEHVAQTLERLRSISPQWQRRSGSNS